MRFFLTAALSILIFASGAVRSFAQFYTNGDDPGSVRWMKVNTPNYSIIYPRGLDSLAKVYGNELERFRISESISSGLIPGEGYRKRTPVVLHAFNGVSNGSVTWAPKRIDLYTLPDAYNPEPLPWAKSLAVHESRHMAQMQFGYKGWLKPLTYVFGDMAVGAYSALWPNTWMLEGDAVVAETALTNMGRGRSADFLDYYQFAFAINDYRNWYRWRYGSYRHYAPNHYALGYMTIAGMRYSFGDSLFTERYFSRIARNPFRFFNLQKTVSEATGMKFKDSFNVIMQDFNEIWEQEKKKRGDSLTTLFTIDNRNLRWFTERSGVVYYNGKLYAISSSMAESPSLIEFNLSGHKDIRRLHSFASNTSRLKAANGKLYWSESVPSARWSLKMSSRIRSYDLETGEIGNITKNGRFFNPEVSKFGLTIAAVEYPVEGGSAIVLMDQYGKIWARKAMPDGLQAVEPCFVTGKLAFTAISEAGTGIYCVNADLSGDIDCLIAPQPVSIGYLDGRDSTLYFTSDRDGSRQLYSIAVGDTDVYQHSSFFLGGKYCFNDDGSVLYSTPLRDGRRFCETDSCFLDKRVVDFSDVYKYPVAEKLSEQEKALAADKNIKWADTDRDYKTEFSEPRKYRKIVNIPRFHSWAPLYFNYDNIKNLSGDLDYETASVGATALFQNSLGTAYGSVGYSWHKDPYDYLYVGGKHRHSAHLNLTYSGLYPVFELNLDINDRSAIQYHPNSSMYYYWTKDYEIFRTVNTISGILSDKPSVEGDITAYIPFNFSSGGVSRGLIPQINYGISNDRFSKSRLTLVYQGGQENAAIKNSTFPAGQGAPSLSYKLGDNVLMQDLTLSLRGYAMRNKAESAEYPRLGIGAEIGYKSRVALNDFFSAGAYAYMYGYLPGFTKTQGFRLTLLGQHQFKSEFVVENAVKTAPRGFSSSLANNYIAANSRNNVRATLDYSIPIYVGDITWFCPVAYIKNFVLTPCFDYTLFQIDPDTNNGKGGTGSLFSAGFDLVARLGNLLWIPYDCSIGISVDFNGGPSFNEIKNGGYPLENHHIGLVFDIDF